MIAAYVHVLRKRAAAKVDSRREQEEHLLMYGSRMSTSEPTPPPEQALNSVEVLDAGAGLAGRVSPRRHEYGLYLKHLSHFSTEQIYTSYKRLSATKDMDGENADCKITADLVILNSDPVRNLVRKLREVECGACGLRQPFSQVCINPQCGNSTPQPTYWESPSKVTSEWTCTTEARVASRPASLYYPHFSPFT
jgi:hypothetical protein